MGGDCSQKAHASERTAILSEALEHPAQCESKLYRNAGLHDDPDGSTMETAGKAEAGSGGDQPAEE
jgi:hypothetical protein